jgi:hypothetical protein
VRRWLHLSPRGLREGRRGLRHTLIVVVVVVVFVVSSACSKPAPAPVVVAAVVVAAPAALDPAIALRLQARGLADRGDFDGALRVFDEAVSKSDPANRLGLQCERAALLSRRAAAQPDPKVMERDLRAAVVDCPGEAMLGQALANALLLRARALGDGVDVRVLRRGLLEESMSLHESAAAAVDLARLCDDADDAVCAASAAEKAVALVPDNPGLLALRDRLKRHGEAEANFSSARHQHFVARFEGYGDERVAWGALDVLEQAWFTVGAALDLRPVEPITVVIYTGAKYAQATATPDWSAGVFDGKIRIREGQLQADKGSLDDTLIHEYVHAALRNCVPGAIPTWFHEGLAQQQEKRKLDPRALVARTGKASVAMLNAPFIKLNEADAHSAYATARWMVETLVDKRGVYGVQQLLAEMKQGKSFDEALQRAFATTTEALWASLT